MIIYSSHFKDKKLKALEADAFKLYDAKQFDKAIEKLLKILKSVPTDVNTLSNVATLYWELEDYKNALAYFSKCSSVDPYNWSHRMNSAQCYAKLGKYTEAINSIVNIIAYMKDQAPGEAFNNIAKYYWLDGQREEAIEQYLRNLKTRPGDLNALKGIAEAYFLMQQYEKSLEFCEKVLEKSPNDVSSLMKAGSILADQKQFEPARAKLLQALKLDPKQHDAAFILAKIDIQTGNNKEAAKKLVDLNKTIPNNYEIIFFLGTALGNGGNLPQAIEAFEYVTKLKPDFADAWRSLAMCYNHLGEKEKATACEVKLKTLTK
ncbi:MAG: tetratricopeptide repeat protein [Candidatus Heimdallarchaeota archaeon]|nr:tetratricopeptide repeat protein [Candidatus Heimdallarchaeota archaeon]